MGWNYLSAPKLKQMGWSLEMDKSFYHTFYCNYLSMLALKLNNISKRDWGSSISSVVPVHKQIRTWPSRCLWKSQHWVQFPWWRHQMETFSALMAICAGNSPVPSEFLAQRPVTRGFDVFFDLRTNTRLSKHWWGWWFETPSRSLWRHCNDLAISYDDDAMTWKRFPYRALF